MLQNMMNTNGPLTIYYNEMLLFKTNFTKDHSKVKKSLRWSFERDEMNAVVSRLRSLESVLDAAIASDEL